MAGIKRHIRRESKVEEYLRHRIRAIGGRALKWVSPGFPGVPDRICFFPPFKIGCQGLIIFVEVKKEGKDVSPDQARVLTMLHDYFGHNCNVISTKEEVDNLIRVYEEAKNELHRKDTSNTGHKVEDTKDSISG